LLEKILDFASEIKWFYLMPGVVFAGTADVDKLWVLTDISVGVCSLPNLIAVLALSGVFFKLKKYFLETRNEYATGIIDSSKNYVRTAK